MYFIEKTANKQKTGICLIVFLLTVIFTSCTPSREYLLKRSEEIGIDKHYVKVLVLKTSNRVLITASTRIKISDMKSRKVYYDNQAAKIYFYPEKITRPIVIESWNSPVRVNGTSYRGTIEIHSILGKIHVINVLKMDDYLKGVLPGEVLQKWEMEALKAQAVAARTYAYYHIIKKKNALYDLDATNMFQVYKGTTVETERTNKAVTATSGEVITYQNKPILAYFHSTCGGKTVDDKFVWSGSDMLYLKDVRCNYCKDSPHYSWNEKLSLYEMKYNLSKRFPGIGNITGMTLKKIAGRVKEVSITHSNGILKLSGNDFRLAFPGKKIKSLYFEARKVKDGLMLHGHGWGHGVGMCQYGAQGMAHKGAGYKKILQFYYNDVRIMNIGGNRSRTASNRFTGNNLSNK